MDNELFFENQSSEISFDVPMSGGSVNMDYSKATNKPSINGVVLEGNKTTEELGIVAGSDIELITKLEAEDIENDLEPNQVYNGNAIHDLARLFGMTLEELMTTLPNIIKEFDIEKTYQDGDVYNANAIHQLMQIFGQEITNLQTADVEINDELESQATKITKLNLTDIEINKKVDNFEERITSLETITSELEEI